MATYRLFVPPQAVGANLVYFDLFNASGSNMDLEVMEAYITVQGSVAVVGTLGVNLYLTRTTAVGTGGTAATQNGATLTASTFSGVDTLMPLPIEVTARLTPTGGATAGAVLSFRSVFTEETAQATYWVGGLIARPADCPGVRVNEGSGIRVVQGAVASVGNIGFDVIFRAYQK